MTFYPGTLSESRVRQIAYDNANRSNNPHGIKVGDVVGYDSEYRGIFFYVVENIVEDWWLGATVRRLYPNTPERKGKKELRPATMLHRIKNYPIDLDFA